MRTVFMLNFVSFLLILLLLGCEKEIEHTIDSEKKMENNTHYNFPADGELSSRSSIIITEGDFSAVLNPVTEQILSYSVSQSFLDSRSISFTTLDSLLRAEMGSDYDFLFNDEDFSSLSDNPFSECMQGCDERHRDENGNKIPGYGRCRFRCWLDFTVRLVDAFVPG